MAYIRVMSGDTSNVAGALPVRLLVVDDDRSLRVALSEALREYEVTLAQDAEHARRLLDESAFDAILLDVMLPGASGTALLDELLAATPEVGRKVCLMTGDHSLVRARPTTPVLLKPFTRAQLDTALGCLRAMDTWDEPDPPSTLVDPS